MIAIYPVRLLKNWFNSFLQILNMGKIIIAIYYLTGE
jgi:hypothetical protein